MPSLTLIWTAPVHLLPACLVLPGEPGPFQRPLPAICIVVSLVGARPAEKTKTTLFLELKQHLQLLPWYGSMIPSHSALFSRCCGCGAASSLYVSCRVVNESRIPPPFPCATKTVSIYLFIYLFLHKENRCSALLCCHHPFDSTASVDSPIPIRILV